MKHSRIAQDVAHAWARNLRLGAGNALAKFLLCMLSHYVNGEGECFVSSQHLAEDCEISSRSVRRYLEWLETEAKVIERVPQWRDVNGVRNSEGRGRPTTALIRLLIPGVEKSSVEYTDEIDQADDEFQVDSLSTKEPLARRLPGVCPALVANTDSLNMNMKKDARARARVGTRASALKVVAATPALKEPTQFVCRDTREWFAIDDWHKRRGKTMQKCPYHGVGNHVNHTGRDFPVWMINEALHERAERKRATGPPDADLVNEERTESERGSDHAWRQSAASL